jgi:steroid delta-isomerase-like uncharacterized protein
MEANRRLIERYYNDLWNTWNFPLAEELISPSVKFHGSVGVSVRGLDEFRAYMKMIQSAFPDFHNTIEEMAVEKGRVAVRLTYRGTHRGTIFGVAPAGRAIIYDGLALFHIEDGKIASGYVLGNVLELLRQLGITLSAK